MDKKSKINFKTPSGLKIRLNHRYFFYQLTKTDRYCTEEEIVNNDVMYNATVNIENMFIIPTMLVQIFTLFAVIFHLSLPVFCIVSLSLYLFGCIWRCIPQDFLLSTILMFFSSVYKMLNWLLYIALIVLVFALDRTYLILPYIAIRAACFVLEILLNKFISNMTYKKYGVPFNDSEICAFIVFYILSKSTMKLSDYINLYVSVVHSEEDTATEAKAHTKDQQLSLFDFPCESEIEDLMNTEPLSEEDKKQIEMEIKATKFVNFNLYIVGKGHSQIPLEITKENEELVQKWLDRETNSIYCIEDYKDGSPNYYCTTKEMFDNMKEKFENI